MHRLNIQISFSCPGNIGDCFDDVLRAILLRKNARDSNPELSITLRLGNMDFIRSWMEKTGVSPVC